MADVAGATEVAGVVAPDVAAPAGDDPHQATSEMSDVGGVGIGSIT